MDALTTALTAATLALIGKIVSDQWTLHQQRRGIAAALAGEIGAYARTFDMATTIPNFEKLLEFPHSVRSKRLRSISKPPSGHPVFDKVADKIGLLPTNEATDISAFYNFITGVRVNLSHISTTEFAEADNEVQVASLRFLIDQANVYFPAAQGLVVRLEGIASQPFLPWLARTKPWLERTKLAVFKLAAPGGRG